LKPLFYFIFQSESSADKTNIGASVNNMKFKNLKELRQPTSIPKILNQNFPQLTESCQTEIHVTKPYIFKYIFLFCTM